MIALDITDTRESRHTPPDGGAERSADQRAAPGVLLECRRVIAPGCRLMLDGLDEVIVGRGGIGGVERAARTARVVVGDFETSRQHLMLRRKSGGWEVVDLGSRNGTLVNGEWVRVAS